MRLVKEGNLFGPEELGRCDVLIGGGIILAIEKSIDPKTLPGDVTVINASDMLVVPGFIDGHQHFIGGGGEGGFHTRTPGMQLSDNIANGVTTAVGLLGTDSLTRSVENLYAKTKAFNVEGMTALMLTGSYWIPSPTLCGSVARDITFLDPVIGVKLAMADQRGPSYDARDLAVLASDVRVAALVSDKPGIITVHVGVNPHGLDLLFDVIKHHAIRPDMFIPTHINRKDSKVRDQALELAEMGGFIDATCVQEQLPQDAPNISGAGFASMADHLGLLEQLCFSSDAGGSLPKWNQDKSRILSMGMGSPKSLLFELTQLVQIFKMPLEKALLPLTVNPAKIYGLTGKKGEISVGVHADILILDPDTLTIRDVVAKGEIMMRNSIMVKKGYFE